MAALAESLVDEWLNRQGFFTVRGLKHGVDEIDLLGIRQRDGQLEAWHVEVQASFRPIGYIAPIPKESVEGFAKSKTSAKNRPVELVRAAVAAWVKKKFESPSKSAAREAAWPGLSWRYVFVHAVVRDQAELQFIAKRGVTLVPLHTVLSELEHAAAKGIRGGAGTDLSEIIEYFHKFHANTDTSGT
jgi:hypothetical protein